MVTHWRVLPLQSKEVTSSSGMQPMMRGCKQTLLGHKGSHTRKVHLNQLLGILLLIFVFSKMLPTRFCCLMH